MHIDVIVSGLASVVSGLAGVVIGALITYKLQNRLLNKQLEEQQRIESERLRLDLFDRRYKVYDTARTFLIRVFEAEGPDIKLFEFNAGTSDAEFLFHRDVVAWLAEVRKRAVHLGITKTLLSRPPSDDAELLKLANAQNDDLSWLIKQSMAMTDVFMPYLGFPK